MLCTALAVTKSVVQTFVKQCKKSGQVNAKKHVWPSVTSSQQVKSLTRHIVMNCFFQTILYSTSSWTSESQSVSINSESGLLDSSNTDQMSSSSTFDDSNCYEVCVSNCSSVVTNDDINGDTVC